MNKIKTTMLIALAVSSTATITSMAAERLETVEGTINSAQAFINGTYVFEGSRNEDSDYDVYYFNGYNDTVIEDVCGTGSKYGTYYIDFEDDEVLFNLTNGQKEEDNSEERIFTLENNLRKNIIRKTDRYEDVVDYEFKEKLAQDTFGEVWYEYILMEDENTTYDLYVSENGSYIEAGYVLNITHYRKEDDGSITKVKIEDYDDLIDEGYVISYEKTLLTDKDYIYRLLMVTNKDNPYDSMMYAQKISKEQGKIKNGAYLPKKVSSYEIGDLAADLMPVLNHYNGNLSEAINDGALSARMLNNSLYLILPKENSITIKKYDLKNNKINGYVRKTLKLDDDFDNIEDHSMKAYSIDVYGNPWIIDKGRIQKLVGDDFETIYITDSSMNNLSVFNDTSLIAWNSEKEIYSVVSPKQEASEEAIVSGEGGAAADTESENSDEVNNSAGWLKNENGTWSYLDENNEKVKGWLKDNNKWYYLNEDGIMMIKWIKDNDSWYYLNEDGSMKTGWHKDTNGNWYYLNSNGSMAKDTTINGYKLGSDGALK